MPRGAGIIQRQQPSAKKHFLVSIFKETSLLIPREPCTWARGGKWSQQTLLSEISSSHFQVLYPCELEYMKATPQKSHDTPFQNLQKKAGLILPTQTCPTKGSKGNFLGPKNLHITGKNWKCLIFNTQMKAAGPTLQYPHLHLSTMC